MTTTELPAPPENLAGDKLALWLAERDRVFARPAVTLDFGPEERGTLMFRPFGGELSQVAAVGRVEIPVGVSVVGQFTTSDISFLDQAPSRLFAMLQVENADDAAATVIGSGDLADRVGMTGALTESGVEALGAAPSLVQLFLESDEVTGSGLGGCSRLQILGLTGSSVQLAAIPRLESLTMLYLTGPRSLDGLADVDITGRFPALDSLTLMRGHDEAPEFDELLPLRRALPDLVVNGLQLSPKALERLLARR